MTSPPPSIAATFRRLAAIAVCCIPAAAWGQAPKPWRLFEADPATVKYRDDLRLGTFDEASKDYLSRLALPQLALEVNRPLIDRVRRRMRETLCGDSSSDAQAAAQATTFVMQSMADLARDGRADLVVRVNAMLLVGELKGVDQKPWPAAVAVLAEALADSRLPMPVRIAAAAGLARHVGAAPKAAAPAAGPMLVKILAEAGSDADPTATAWLRSRALAMLATLGPAAPPETAAAAVKILDDVSQPIDVRVRAAAAAGATMPARGLDTGRLVDEVRKLALAAAEGELSEAERLRTRASFTGQGHGATIDRGAGPGMAAADTLKVMPLACRRAAWRFDTLADALASDDGAGGLAAAAGPRKADAETLSQALRKAAGSLDKNPEEPTLVAAVQAIGGRDAPATAPAPQATPEPAAPGTPPEPAAPPEEANPFGNPFGQ